MNTNIFLIGPSGVGKTTVGKKLSSMRKFKFYDVDELIVARAGVDLSWILDKEGAEGLLKREESVIQDLSAETRVVVATGENAIKSANNCDNMGKSGLVVYLENAMNDSAECYREVADIIVSISNKGVMEVVYEILDKIKF